MITLLPSNGEEALCPSDSESTPLDQQTKVSALLFPVLGSGSSPGVDPGDCGLAGEGPSDQVHELSVRKLDRVRKRGVDIQDKRRSDRLAAKETANMQTVESKADWSKKIKEQLVKCNIKLNKWSLSITFWTLTIQPLQLLSLTMISRAAWTTTMSRS